MNRSSGSVMLLALLMGVPMAPPVILPPPTPGPPATWRMQVVDVVRGVDYRRYTTLIVKDVQTAVGDNLPKEVGKQLPEVVIAHLRECYPATFVKTDRTASGAGEELVMEGSVTVSWGIRKDPALDFFGDREVDELIINTSLADGGTARRLAEVTVEYTVLSSGRVTTLNMMKYKLDAAARDIAAAVAEKRGLAVLRRSEYWGNVNRYGLKAERCYR